MITDAVLHTCPIQRQREDGSNGAQGKRTEEDELLIRRGSPGGATAGGIYGRLRVTGEGSTLFSFLSRLVVLGSFHIPQVTIKKARSVIVMAGKRRRRLFLEQFLMSLVSASLPLRSDKRPPRHTRQGKKEKRAKIRRQTQNGSAACGVA